MFLLSGGFLYCLRQTARPLVQDLTPAKPNLSTVFGSTLLGKAAMHRTSWCLGNVRANGHSFGQRNIRGQVGFHPLVQEQLFPEVVPMISRRWLCDTASMAFHGAWERRSLWRYGSLARLGGREDIRANARPGRWEFLKRVSIR